MSNQNYNNYNKNLLKELGEDTAYTFKGLYKMADWLRLEYKILIFTTLSISLIICCFDNKLSDQTIKILSIITLSASIWLLINQKEYEKSPEYRQLADNYKNLYDKIRNCYYLNKFEDLEKIQEEINALRKKLYNYPIGKIARLWSRHVIKKEMNLDWIYDDKE